MGAKMQKKKTIQTVAGWSAVTLATARPARTIDQVQQSTNTRSRLRTSAWLLSEIWTLAGSWSTYSDSIIIVRLFLRAGEPSKGRWSGRLIRAGRAR